ncbi:MAG TPA: sigma-70 family RNA polymerase sigma factor [Bacteroidales bacterium]|nr:sigma-70 family RNA polymerase sigma factor [Bacteroidales bacterium]HRR93275.1 sigma-70 family RNA polymerase sigma factor [Bacteroidales bacterium]HRT88651.1 sigma-70 family RNA polymerase sigma factor [Bacteroidales bacterium]
MEDKEDIKNLKKGDVISFDNIFRKYNRKVYYFAKSYLKDKDEAEDVVQDVFMNLWRFREQINEYNVFSRYLFKITFNAVCRKFRKMRPGNKSLDSILERLDLEDNSTNLEVEFNNILETVNQLIAKMRSREKEVFLLSTNEQLDNDQIASRLGISRKSVDNYLSNAKTFLKKSLTERGILYILFFWLFLY